MRILLATINYRQIFLILAFSLILHYSLSKLGKRIPYCLYYQNDTTKLKELGERRRQESVQTIADIRQYRVKTGDTGPLFDRCHPCKLCVGVVSIARNEGSYLTQSVAAMLSRTSWELQDEIRIFIHNINSPPEENREALDLKDLLFLKNVTYNPELNPETLSHAKPTLRETLDYIATLEILLESDCEYSLVVEDDALAATNWAFDLLDMLDSLDDDNLKPWIVLKLFSSFKWIPWFFGENHAIFDVFQLLAATIVVVAVIIAIYWICVMLFFHISRKDEDFVEAFELPTGKLVEANILSTIALSVTMGLFLYCAGKPNVVPYEDGVHSVSIGASAVANLYPRIGLKLLHEHLTREFVKLKSVGKLENMKNKDLYFRKLRNELEKTNGVQYQELIRLPNLFQHIGVQTSLGKFSSHETTVVSPHFLDDDKAVRLDERVIKKTRSM